MHTRFPIFNSHLDLAHSLWKNLIKPGHQIIDATCGNGNDTLFLASLVTDHSLLYALDIQQTAIETTKNLLLTHPKVNQIRFINQCHSSFPGEIPSASVQLIVYNLGYLPKGDKKITTKKESTLESLKKAEILIQPGGAISITCYPGHEEGKHEEEAILQWCSQLPPTEWSCCFHRWLNRKDSPSLLLIQKGVS